MTTREFSDEFDTLYSNVTANRLPGLDEYQKSVFLTKAQEELLKAYFDNRTNRTMRGFDDGQKRQIDFSGLTDVKVSVPEEAAVFDPHENSRKVEMPERMLAIVNEAVDVTRNGDSLSLTVLPIRYDEYDRMMSKPYKRPFTYQAWRLIGSPDGSRICDLVPGPEDTITSYRIRYIRLPRAIVLDKLEYGVSIDGVKEPQECELDEALHREILQRAVELARVAFMGDLNSELVTGRSSHTEIGSVTQGGQ